MWAFNFLSLFNRAGRPVFGGRLLDAGCRLQVWRRYRLAEGSTSATVVRRAAAIAAQQLARPELLRRTRMKLFFLCHFKCHKMKKSFHHVSPCILNSHMPLKLAFVASHACCISTFICCICIFIRANVSLHKPWVAQIANTALAHLETKLAAGAAAAAACIIFFTRYGPHCFRNAIVYLPEDSFVSHCTNSGATDVMVPGVKQGKSGIWVPRAPSPVCCTVAGLCFTKHHRSDVDNA